MPILTFKRQDLLDALEARRPWAERLDAERLDAHTKAEKEYLAKFRAACREALKWNYAEAKEHRFQLDMSSRDRPTCPVSLVAEIDRNLNVLRSTRQSRFTVSASGNWSRLYYLLTHDETIKTEMC